MVQYTTLVDAARLLLQTVCFTALVFASESKRYYSLRTRKSVHGNEVTGQRNNFVPMSQADTMEDVDVPVQSNFSHAKTWQT